MNQFLFDRSTGFLSPQAFARFKSTQLIHKIQFSPTIRFDGGETEPVLHRRHESSTALGTDIGDQKLEIWAHQAGVNALVVDRFEKRLLLSGGADSSIKLWDLNFICPASNAHTLTPKGAVSKSTQAHSYGITHLSFYPFDSAAFISSSYDHTLKVYATEGLALSASFDLTSVVYTHALSPIASHLLVACATQHPAIRLVDLRSGSASHSLAGHQGALLALEWSPISEYILASGGIDGTARIWDVRKSSGMLGWLDMEDSVGILGQDGIGLGQKPRTSSKAHSGAVNGVSWTDDGLYIITVGHDERIRVWDATTGANTLASFGPTLKNAHLSNHAILTPPTALTPPGKELLFYPNEQEILMFDLHEGKLIKRLKIPGAVTAAVRSRTGDRHIRNRLTALAWHGASEGFYSGHSDGQIRLWAPSTCTADDDDISVQDANQVSQEMEEDGNKRKRQVLDDVFKDLTRQKITFG